LINPEQLDGWQPDDTRVFEYRELFDHKQMLNRPEGIVAAVFIHGEHVFDGSDVTEALGTRRLGRALRAA